MGATRVITAVVAQSLATLESAVSIPQLRVLVMITARGPLNLTAVADGLGVNPSNASRTCERLVSEGYLDRRDDPQDRRNLTLTLTEDGTRMVNTVMHHRRQVLQQILGRMSANQRKQLSRSMQAFTNAAASVTDGGGLSDGEGHLLRWLT